MRYFVKYCRLAKFRDSCSLGKSKNPNICSPHNFYLAFLPYETNDVSLRYAFRIVAGGLPSAWVTADLFDDRSDPYRCLLVRYSENAEVKKTR